MSQQHSRLDLEALPDPICEFCGEQFDPHEGRECPALEEGRCAP
ncbi:MAG: hypothetical protein V5A39_13495 [Haloarculaceae archaeon]